MGEKGSTCTQWLDYFTNEYVPDTNDSHPNFIVLILGGNDFQDGVEVSQVKEACRQLLCKLKDIFPDANLIKYEVECRFYSDTSRHSKAPPLSIYDAQSKTFNKWLFRQKKFTWGTVRSRGPFGFDNPELYKPDGVHLLLDGLHCLARAIQIVIIKELE